MTRMASKHSLRPRLGLELCVWPHRWCLQVVPSSLSDGDGIGCRWNFHLYHSSGYILNFPKPWIVVPHCYRPCLHLANHIQCQRAESPETMSLGSLCLQSTSTWELLATTNLVTRFAKVDGPHLEAILLILLGMVWDLLMLPCHKVVAISVVGHLVVLLLWELEMWVGQRICNQ